jgi:hypothetical protein
VLSQYRDICSRFKEWDKNPQSGSLYYKDLSMKFSKNVPFWIIWILQVSVYPFAVTLICTDLGLRSVTMNVEIYLAFQKKKPLCICLYNISIFGYFNPMTSIIIFKFWHQNGYLFCKTVTMISISLPHYHNLQLFVSFTFFLLSRGMSLTEMFRQLHMLDNVLLSVTVST